MMRKLYTSANTTKSNLTKLCCAIPLTTAFVVAINLLLLSVAAPAQAHELKNLSNADRAALRTEIRSYLLENPEILIEVANRLEEIKTATAAAKQQAVLSQGDRLFDDPNSWVGGNLQGDITIVEFIDYRCGYCRRAHPEIAALLASDSGIRLVIKEYPILSEDSFVSAQFALAALRKGGRDAYKAVHDFLISYNEPVNDATADILSRLSSVPKPDLVQEANSQEVVAIIRANRQLAEDLSISGTPAFVIGSTVFGGYAPARELQKLVDSERAKRR